MKTTAPEEEAQVPGPAPSSAQPHRRVPHPPDLQGGAVQHLPIAVPGAAGDGAAAGRVVAADLAQPLLARLTLLILRLLRHKLESLDSVNFDEGEVELARGGTGVPKVTVWGGVASPEVSSRQSGPAPTCTWPPWGRSPRAVLWATRPAHWAPGSGQKSRTCLCRHPAQHSESLWKPTSPATTTACDSRLAEVLVFPTRTVQTATGDTPWAPHFY